MGLGFGLNGFKEWRVESRSTPHNEHRVVWATRRNYVEAVGGRLTLVAQFPDQEPIAIGGLAEILPKEIEKPKRRAAHAR
jgi:hypothetical protein